MADGDGFRPPPPAEAGVLSKLNLSAAAQDLEDAEIASVPSSSNLLPSKQNQPLSYARIVQGNKKTPHSSVLSQVDPSTVCQDDLPLKPLSIFEGEPAVLFTCSDKTALVNKLQYVLVGKFSHGRPALSSIKDTFAALKLQGKYNLSVFDNKHLFIELELKIDYVRIWLKISWLIAGCAMRIFKWGSEFTPAKESTTGPVWIRIEGIPLYLFDKLSLLSIANAIGHPLSLHPLNVNRAKLNTAIVCVELDVSKPLKESFYVCFEDDISRRPVESIRLQVFYDVVPPYCSSCMHMGHHVDFCKRGKVLSVAESVEKQRLGNSLSAGNSHPTDFSVHESSPGVSFGVNHIENLKSSNTHIWTAVQGTKQLKASKTTTHIKAQALPTANKFNSLLLPNAISSDNGVESSVVGLAQESITDVHGNAGAAGQPCTWDLDGKVTDAIFDETATVPDNSNSAALKDTRLELATEETKDNTDHVTTGTEVQTTGVKQGLELGKIGAETEVQQAAQFGDAADGCSAGYNKPDLRSPFVHSEQSGELAEMQRVPSHHETAAHEDCGVESTADVEKGGDLSTNVLHQLDQGVAGTVTDGFGTEQRLPQVHHQQVGCLGHLVDRRAVAIDCGIAAEGDGAGLVSLAPKSWAAEVEEKDRQEKERSSNKGKRPTAIIRHRRHASTDLSDLTPSVGADTDLSGGPHGGEATADGGINSVFHTPTLKREEAPCFLNKSASFGISQGKYNGSDLIGCKQKLPSGMQDSGRQQKQGHKEQGPSQEKKSPQKQQAKPFHTDLPIDFDPMMVNQETEEKKSWSQIVGGVKLLTRRSISPIGRSSEKLIKLRKRVDYIEYEAGKTFARDLDEYLESNKEQFQVKAKDPPTPSRNHRPRRRRGQGRVEDGSGHGPDRGRNRDRR